MEKIVQEKKNFSTGAWHITGKIFSPIGKTLKWIGKHFMGMLFVLIAIVILSPKSPTPYGTENLQEIKLSGPITTSDAIIKEIEAAQKNPKIKGVLLTVDSPGGAVPPSIEIAYAIKELKGHKPVVAYASGIMASGSYYSSIHANKIIANPGAIIGSIGVIVQRANVGELMSKIGIKEQIVKQGTYKQAGTPTRDWTPEERQELETLAKDAYRMFVGDVAKARGLDINKSKDYADAHIFAAERAMNVGLVDELGVKTNAKAELAKIAKVDNPVWKEKSKIDSLIEKMETSAILNFKGYYTSLMAIF